MDKTDSRLERLNYLAIGLIAAAGVHSLLCLAGVPAALHVPQDGGLAILRVLKAFWNVLGVAGGLATAGLAFFMLNARSYHWAQRVPLAAAVLPIFGTVGLATAFALIPLAGLAYMHLRDPRWCSAFMDGPYAGWVPPVQEQPVEASAEEAQLEEVHEEQFEETEASEGLHEEEEVHSGR